jgi:hypothetical protein
MDGVKMPVNPGSSTLYFLMAILIALAVAGVSYMMITTNKTIPSGKQIEEGFQGPSRGVSSIPCGQESSYAVALSGQFAGRESTTEEGPADLTELKLILSKLCCMKHDLMSTAQVVQASLYIPYNNTHDRENPADTVARCFTKSIPSRDLDISFETWRDRGLVLLSRLCTSYNLSDSEERDAKNNLMSCWSDSYDVARTVCTPNTPPSQGSPRDPKGFTPEAVKELGPYKGYY